MTRNLSKCLPLLVLVSFMLKVLGTEVVTELDKDILEPKKKKPPGYRTKEVIEKAPTEDHPCTLIRTSERISFPALRDELFVNFLGYKEPNLVHVMRCRGVCGERGAPIACRAVKIQERKVLMMFRTNSSGRDSKHRIKELILDEHVECGCQCLNNAHCVGIFNEVTCDCECDENRFGQRRRVCEETIGTYWEASMCRCMSKSVAPRGLDGQHCSYPDMNQGNRDHSSLHIVQYVTIGAGITVSIFLLTASYHYKNKYEKLKKRQKSKSREKLKKPRKTSHGKHIARNKHKHTNGGVVIDDTIKILKNGIGDAPELVGGDVDLYHEQYDEHGVRIEIQVPDSDLIAKYLERERE